MSVGEVAEILDVHPQTVRRYCDDGRLASLKIGGSRRVRVESVEQLLAGVVGEEAARELEPILLAGDPIGLMAARIGLSPRAAALRPDLLEGREVVPAGAHLARFAREHCRLIELGEVGAEGPKLGDPYELVEFEREFFDEALSCDDAGRRLYRRCGLIVPRKNRKTTTCSVLSLYMGSPADAEHRPRIVQAAGSKAQALKLYETCKGFVDDPRYGSELLQALFNPLEQRIECPSIAGLIFRVAGDGDLNHSLDPSVVITDELHTWRTPKQRENWRALTTAQGGRLDPLVLFLSTEGEGDDNELADVLARLEASSATEVEHRRTGLRIYRNKAAGTIVFKYAIGDSAGLDDMPAFLAANPAPWRTEERLRADLADTFNDEPTKLRLYGNRRAASSSARRWIKPDLWEDARDTSASPGDEDWIPAGVTVAVGADAAITHDTSAVGWAWRDPEGHVRIRCRVWSVREGIAYHDLVDGGRLDNEDHLEPYVVAGADTQVQGRHLRLRSPLSRDRIEAPKRGRTPSRRRDALVGSDGRRYPRILGGARRGQGPARRRSRARRACRQHRRPPDPPRPRRSLEALLDQQRVAKGRANRGDAGSQPRRSDGTANRLERTLI